MDMLGGSERVDQLLLVLQLFVLVLWWGVALAWTQDKEGAGCVGEEQG